MKDTREPVEVQIRDVVDWIWVSRKQGGGWQEATLDREGKLHFGHHFNKDGVLIEADI
jgi:hypothetical protein